MTNSTSNDPNANSNEPTKNADHPATAGNAAGPADLGYEPPDAVVDFVSDCESSPDEGAAELDEVHNEIRKAVQPKDIVEYMWTLEVARLMLQIIALLNRKAAVLSNFYFVAIEEALIEVADGSEVEAARAVLRIEARLAMKKLRQTGEMAAIEPLAKSGYDNSSLMGQAVILGMPVLEKIERLLNSAYKRQRDLLKEIDARRARKVTQVIEKWTK